MPKRRAFITLFFGSQNGLRKTPLKKGKTGLPVIHAVSQSQGTAAALPAAAAAAQELTGTRRRIVSTVRIAAGIATAKAPFNFVETAAPARAPNTAAVPV